MTFYHHFIFCYLIYGIHIYYNLAPAHITNPIFLLQKRAFRLIAFVHFIPKHLISTQDLSRSLNLLPLPQLASYFSATYSYKILNMLAPCYICEQFSFNIHRFQMRDTHYLKPPSNNFLCNLSIIFNRLPQHIRSANNLKLFR
jgi:hypothetical protein